MMIIGTSKERLIELRDGGSSPEFRRTLKWLVHNECKELTPWLPIDENTPKDRELLGFVGGNKRIIKYGKTSHIPLYGFCLADQGVEDFDICTPTHWQELPENPK